MKKYLKYGIIYIVVFCMFLSNANAQTINSGDIPNATYVIGNHMFSREKDSETGYNGQLTTQHIMLAAKTIDSIELSDMIIYQKTAKGKWINALTNADITPPESFEVNYKDTVLMAPILSKEIPCGSSLGCDIVQNNGQFIYDLYIDEYDITLISGWVIYEFKDGNYIELRKSDSIGTFSVYLAPGEKKEYVARVYTIDSKGEEVYSDYSKPLIIDHSGEVELEVPELSLDVNHTEKPLLKVGLTKNEYDNIEIYYGEGNEYPSKLLATTTSTSLELDVDLDTSYSYRARLYKTNSEGKKYYSEYSNIVELKKSSAPTISKRFDGAGALENIGEVYYAITIEKEMPELDAIEIYYSNAENGFYSLYKTIERTTPEQLSYETTARIYKGNRFYYKARGYEKTNGNLTYTDFSDVIVIDYDFTDDDLKIEYTPSEDGTTLGIYTLKYYGSENDTGVYLYSSDKEDGEYKLLESITSNETDGHGNKIFYKTLNLSEDDHKYYKAKIYRELGDGTLIVSNLFTNVVEFNAAEVEVLETPIISTRFDGAGVNSMVYYLIRAYAESVDGIEIYRAEGENGNYELYNRIAKGEENQKIYVDYVEIPIGENSNYYYKVRAYKNTSSVVIYSKFSEAFDIDNNPSELKLEYTPSSDGTTPGTYTLKYNSKDEVYTGIQLYYSDTEEGEYQLLEDVTTHELDVFGSPIFYKTLSLSEGEHKYYKVKVYSNNDGHVSYSVFSNTVEVEVLETPTISYYTTPFIDTDGSKKLGIAQSTSIDTFGTEIYYSETEEGEYKLLETYPPALQTRVAVGAINVSVPQGKTYYFKTRRFKDINGIRIYSKYSNVLLVDNSSN